MSAQSTGGLAYLFDARCGVPRVNFVDALNGERIVGECASYDAYIWAAALGVLAVVVLVVALTVRVPVPVSSDNENSDTKQESTRPVFSPWFAAIPAVGAAIALCQPFFVVREFRATQQNFKTSGLSKAEWTKMSNANAQANRVAGATEAAGLAISGALLAR